MRVTILDGESVIGHADLAASDPGMCVASGAFHPSAHYSRADHANIIDGEYVAAQGVKLRVLSDTYGPIESDAISIQDFPILDEMVVDVLGFPPSYDEIFLNDPTHRPGSGN